MKNENKAADPNRWRVSGPAFASRDFEAETEARKYAAGLPAAWIASVRAGAAPAPAPAGSRTSKEQPYTCDRCGQAYSTITSLTSHYPAHDGLCPACCARVQAPPAGITAAQRAYAIAQAEGGGQ